MKLKCKCKCCGQETDNIEVAFDGIYARTCGKYNAISVIVDIEHLKNCGIKTFATNGQMYAAYTTKFSKAEAEKLLDSMDEQCALEDIWRSK